MERIIALVAGASRGAGKGAALALAEIGSTVYCVGRSTDQNRRPDTLGTIDDTAREVDELGGTGIPLAADCSDPEAVAAIFRRVEEEQGHLHILVNSAWGAHDADLSFGPFHENVAQDWEYMFNRGVKNYLLCSAAAVPLLRAAKQALVANISFWDDDKYIGSLMYDLAKSAMNRLAYDLSVELKKDEVTAVALSPGYMNTEKVQEAMRKDPSLPEKVGLPGESTRYVGRAVTALWQDTQRIEKSGRALRVADLAREYGFTDVDGTQPEAFRL
ncbi:SDR family NAD(P)-dependent oxidoreductase [Flavilitoribacter nigricans]|uniref:Oxidoreductase n=1 Tax=Flavilitoribacter nigricans (strain ATCC 23147 / DSM 23189 / NBRC 102662 / NCIMB 1420 / SS-2) TaxID=1122177 RepID=A0A2D0MZR0_FLAN2|nr:SDR family NAD(P)-dependent oxidoreductase [Flavilitoribacter nigricans]PHN01618.1 oxidoreductase [Flavilitoribacter nigricans DSM 23189 = NBRC 102662]